MALLVAAAMLYSGRLPIERGFASMEFPYQMDREEGFLLVQAIQLARGETIYPDLSGYPYTVGNYPPLYPAVFAGAIGLTGAPPGMGLPIGRAIVMLSLITVLAALATMALREWRGFAGALLAVGLFLCNWEVNDWVAYARVDLPAIALGMTGLAAATSGPSRRALAGCMALFALAFFTKQTQLAAPAAVAVALLWGRQWKRAAWFAGILATVSLAGVAILNVSTSGEFWRHTVLYNANVYYPNQVVVWLRHLAFFGLFKLLAAGALAVAVPVALWGGGESTPTAKAPDLLVTASAFLLFTALSLASVGKAGAAGNYLLEFQAALALFIAVALGRLLERAPAHRWRLTTARAASIAALLLLALHAAHFGLVRSRLLAPGPTPTLAELYGRVLLRVQEAPGSVLCEAPVFNALANRETPYQPFIMAQLAREGKWEQTPFVHDLQDGRFGLIVSTRDFRDEDQVFEGFTPEMRSAILEAYRFEGKIADLYIFSPINQAPQVIDALDKDRIAAPDTRSKGENLT